MLILFWKKPCDITRTICFIVGYRNYGSNPPPPPVALECCRCKTTARRVDCDTGTVSETRFQGFWHPGAIRKIIKNTHLSHVERKKTNRGNPLLTHAHSKSKATAGVGHDELIAIDGDENAKYGRSCDREGDVRRRGWWRCWR